VTNNVGDELSREHRHAFLVQLELPPDRESGGYAKARLRLKIIPQGEAKSRAVDVTVKRKLRVLDGPHPSVLDGRLTSSKISVIEIDPYWAILQISFNPRRSVDLEQNIGD
jgi:hypothetical protein